MLLLSNNLYLYVTWQYALLRHHATGGGGWEAQRSLYEVSDCSSLALNAAGEGANFISTFKTYIACIV